MALIQAYKEKLIIKPKADNSNTTNALKNFVDFLVSQSINMLMLLLRPKMQDSLNEHTSLVVHT